MKIFVPPIKCQGIKTKLVEWIVQKVNLENQGRWIEPFMGSGVVGFNIRPQRAIFSDINPHIINFYNAIKSGEITAQTARTFLEHEGAILRERGESYYYEVRERFNNNKNSFDMLFLNRASFNGVMRFNKKGFYNVPFGHKPERFAKSYVTKIVNQIDYVSRVIRENEWEFICGDYKEIISKSNENDFIYCDPPYFGRHTDYFNSWDEKDEQTLYEMLTVTPAKFMLSTWHSNQYRDNQALEKYSSGFTVLTREHFYHVGAKEKNRNPMLEAIVMNYSSEHQLQISV